MLVVLGSVKVEITRLSGSRNTAREMEAMKAYDAAMADRERIIEDIMLIGAVR